MFALQTTSWISSWISRQITFSGWENRMRLTGIVTKSIWNTSKIYRNCHKAPCASRFRGFAFKNRHSHKWHCIVRKSSPKKIRYKRCAALIFTCFLLSSSSRAFSKAARRFLSSSSFFLRCNSSIFRRYSSCCFFSRSCCCSKRLSFSSSSSFSRCRALSASSFFKRLASSRLLLSASSSSLNATALAVTKYRKHKMSNQFQQFSHD